MVVYAALKPYLFHPSMVSKWVGLAAAATVVALWPAQLWWAWVLGGIAIVFPTEYVVHRFVLHVWAAKGWNGPGAYHTAHHQDPDNLAHVFHPTWYALAIGVPYALLAGLVGWSWQAGVAFLLGTLVGTIYYEWYHYQAHQPLVKPRTRWGRFLKQFHTRHHYKSEHHWFGVTSPFFDRLFGTGPDHRDVERSPTVRHLRPPEHAAAAMDEA
ncbi:MAG: sterol desaturase family protein [Thermoplasmatota archaeon]